MGYRVGRSETEALRAIDAELAVVRPDRSAVADTLPEIRRLLDLQTILVVSPIVDESGLHCERFESDGFEAPERIGELFSIGFAKSPPRYAWYDPASPEPWQRNRVLDARDLMSADELSETAFYRQCLRPGRLHYQRQPRVLLCDGRTLLGWFGSFHDGAVEQRHYTLLRRLIAPMRRRLALDRLLGLAERRQRAIELAIEEIAAPAMIVGRNGEIHEVNAAMSRVPRRDAADAVRDAIAGRAGTLHIDLTPLAERGTNHGWLAIVRSSPSERIAAALDSASEQWSLTPRQREVLEGVVAGKANMTIAIELGITERAVEMQISILLGRAGVPSRAGLVSVVLAIFG